MPTSRIDDDPVPQPPERPGLEDCCRSGCVPCVFDLYEEAMERYRIELKAWEDRHMKHKGQGAAC
jgi:hypothetical protein